jgi:hypothetical protein
MSEMGHQRRFEHAPGASAMPPIPDLLLSRSKRRSGPQAAVSNRSKAALIRSLSSARACNEGGTSMPTIFAVLRLMTNSYLVGAWTGKSAGFSPLRV